MPQERHPQNDPWDSVVRIFKEHRPHLLVKEKGDVGHLACSGIMSPQRMAGGSRRQVQVDGKASSDCDTRGPGNSINPRASFVKCGFCPWTGAILQKSDTFRNWVSLNIFMAFWSSCCTQAHLRAQPMFSLHTAQNCRGVVKGSWWVTRGAGASLMRAAGLCYHVCYRVWGFRVSLFHNMKVFKWWNSFFPLKDNLSLIITYKINWRK